MSYFLLFDEIMNDRSIEKDRNYNNVRKFCQKIIREFFAKSKSNPVLFCEILFYKTPHAVDDINEPGIVHQRILEKNERESRRGRRHQRNAIDNMDDDDFDDEDDYQLLDSNMAPWTDPEDKLLRDHYSTYAQQGNVAAIMQQYLENELQSTRSVAQVL